MKIYSVCSIIYRVAKKAKIKKERMLNMKNSKIMKTIIFIVVLLIPIIYSFFYLKSYWNPYGNLTDMKIAVVNLDKGQNDENQGKEFIDGLKKSGTFNIQEVTQEEAKNGMQKGDYYATITIPSNFTEVLNSASTRDKQIATITYSPNQATNYLATQIIGSAVKTMELNLEEKIDSKIIQTLADKLNEVPDSLKEISDGAEQILEGSQNLNSGLKQINDGTTTLNNSYTEFDAGINSAYEGSQSLENGIEQVNSGIGTLSNGSTSLDTAISQINSGVDKLSSQGSQGIANLGAGINQVNQGATSLNEAVTAYADGSMTLANGTIKYVEGTSNLTTNVNNYIQAVNATNSDVKTLINAVQSNEELMQDASIQMLLMKLNAEVEGVTNAGTAINAGSTQLNESNEALKAGANSLITNGEALKEGASNLSQGTTQLAEGASGLTSITSGMNSIKEALSQVGNGTQSLNNGINTLSSGTESLKNGSTTLTAGLSQLNSSSTSVKNALNTLNEGTETAYKGSNELVAGVETFNNQINEGIEDLNEELQVLDGIEQFAENPVEFKTEAYGEVDSYGIAFTPLFLCIGLWVGALMCYVVLYYDQRNRFGILDSKGKNKFIQNAIYIAIGAAQGIITALLLKLGLGYAVENVALYYAASILIGITFMSIIQFLIRNFGDIGKFLALIILVLQLAAAGGTFPIETIDKAFRGVTPFLPMTYSIKLLREILVPTLTNFKGKYFAILIGITCVTLAVTYVVDIVKSKREEEG
ncbi:MAG: YhgE/Pip domain-containing protein [Clostridia bacterium]|nr:YhgE/Pip domain-containing protein [Clostridia bacterium]